MSRATLHGDLTNQDVCLIPQREEPMRWATATTILLTFTIGGAFALFAQTPTAEINGTVMDSQGARVPNAAIRVVSSQTNVATQTTSNSSGSYTILNLLPGPYTLSCEKVGFKTVELPEFVLQVNQTLNENITLPVGEVTE